MVDHRFYDILEDSPVIAAVKDEDELSRCLGTDCRMVFILFGNICNVSELVSKVKDAQKIAVVHIDLISGLSSKEIAADFIKKYTKADGVISTKPALVKRAGDLGLFTVLRVFIIDSMALENLEKEIKAAKPHLVEVLPAVIPSVIEKICLKAPVPVIAGGLITEKDQIFELLNAGVAGVSSSDPDIWVS